MRRVGQARKRDANEPEIVRALEDIGCTVLRVSGPAVPDLLVHVRGRWLPIEVKAKGGKLTPAQEALYQHAPYPIVTSPDEAVALFLQ